MTRKFLIPATLALAAAAAPLLLGACKAGDNAGSAGSGAVVSGPTAKTNNNSAPGPVGTTEVNADGVRRMNVAELRQLVEEGRVAIYDTRAKAAYDMEHIKGALPLPQNEADARAGELPRDKTLVFYCT